jgi:radical SAM family uncharacterized protein/radical SAM-linked protein
MPAQPESRTAPSYRSAYTAEVLPFVAKPSRYVAGEWNVRRKEPATTDVRVALSFPDVYEIGMSHMGLKILYQILNARPDILADRVYAPWLDAEALLRRAGLPLLSQEAGLPLAAFDILGFTLQYELSYGTILTMLELAGLPLRAADRDLRHPLVVAGGPAAFAPEPLADFIDAFLVGDGEEAVLELCDVVRDWKRSGGRRDELLRAVKGIAGMYVPALHQPGDMVRKRSTLRLDTVDYGCFPVPYMEIVHDRANVEVMRGCARGCRFCQAGYIYRPVRELSAESIQQLVERAVHGTGSEEVSLASLSITDLSCFAEVVPSLMAVLAPRRTSLSLPSLRVEALNRHRALAEEIGRVRKTGLTIAPEAGSARLRRIINKEGFDEEQIYSAIQIAAKSGWQSIKFYFMIGLPTETQTDLDELVRVARESARIARRESRRGFGLTVSASSFVPKPHTPFQWFAQEPMEILREKQAFLKARLREMRVEFKWHQVEASFLEAVLGLGGREVGAAIALAQARGCRFDGWTEELKFRTWLEALGAAGVDPFAIANRPRPLPAPLPWDHIDCGVSKAFLLREYHKALQGQATPDCHVGPCNNCGEICRADWRAWARESGMCGGATSGSLTVSAAVTDLGGQPVQRICFEFQKVGELAYLSHLELMRAQQRALRRAGVPLAYTQGFNPQPKISAAQALAVGVEGLRELGEVELTLRMEPADLLARWNRQLPPELKILRAWEAPLHGPSLSAGIRGATYRIRVQPNGWDPVILAGLATSEACAAFLDQDPIPVEVTKKGQPVTLDARPFLQGFSVGLEENGTLAWELLVRAGLGGSVKPQAVMRSFLGRGAPRGDLDRMVSSLRIARTALALEGQG